MKLLERAREGLASLHGCAADALGGLRNPPAPPARELQAAAPVLERILNESIIPFWYPGTLDPEHGGYRLNHDPRGRWLGPADKHAITQARTLWFFARLADGRPGTEDFASAAHSGYEFLHDRLWDGQRGGVFWAVDHSGREVIMPDKHLCAQAFALFAVTGYAQAFRDDAGTAFAERIFQAMETRFRDPAWGGYLEFFASDWSAPRAGQVGYLHAGPHIKLMNTHMHVLEAIAAYLRLTADPAARQRLVELIELLAGTASRTRHGLWCDRHRLDWTPVDRRRAGVSFGHNVELIWLLIDACEAAGLAHDPLLPLYEEVFGRCFRWGFDHREGGFYAAGIPPLPAHRRQKVWWVQAEALMAALHLYRLTGRAFYRECFGRTLDWITRRQVDWEHGDWHAEVLPTGRTRGSKAGPWKGPYHHGRAMLDGLAILATLSPAAEPFAGDPGSS